MQGATGHWSRMTSFGSSSRSRFLLEHDLFRKPVSTFRDHALTPTRLRISLHHFSLEHGPNLAMQLVEGAVELDLGNVARPRHRDLPIADNARGGSRPPYADPLP